MDRSERRYNIQTEDGAIVFQDVGPDNAYLTAYGKYTRGGAPIDDLLVDEFTFREYALSGQAPTVYVVVRVR